MSTHETPLSAIQKAHKKLEAEKMNCRAALRKAFALGVGLMLMTLPKPSNANIACYASISDVQLGSPAPAGWDELQSYENPSVSWVIELHVWNVDYTPTSWTDSGGDMASHYLCGDTVAHDIDGPLIGDWPMASLAKQCRNRNLQGVTPYQVRLTSQTGLIGSNPRTLFSDGQLLTYYESYG